ncbi:MAG: cytidylate kinase [Verrucomicrobia bacterium]|nr:MAG: cytidylate kinase [Verrucomicrobiota bacterium]
MQHIVIAIDGPAASGKSSVSRALAQRLGFVYVNTGAMYRAVTWHALQLAIDPSDASAVEHLLETTALECCTDGGQSYFLINGVDPGEALVSPQVNAVVSKIASQPLVRRRLVAMQRGYAERQPAVVEGRDIGTVVFPNTPHKFYIDASPEVRAARRAGQGLHDSVVQRDAMDSTRKDSPLAVAPDAEVIDSSYSSVDEVVENIFKKLDAKGITPQAR